MKKATIVVGATIAGLIGILTFHTKPLQSIALNNTTARTTSSTHSRTGHAKSSTSSSSGSGSSPNTSSQSSSSTTVPSQNTSTKTSAPTAPSSRNATGSLVQFGYGELSVKVTVKGKRIVDVSVPNVQFADQYSQQLAAQVIPMLRSQVLNAQSVNINGITGATYTSQAYATSLQSALKKLGL